MVPSIGFGTFHRDQSREAVQAEVCGALKVRIICINFWHFQVQFIFIRAR